MTKITTSTTTTAAQIKSRVCRLAYDLAQNNDMTSSEAMRWAWFLVKSNPEAKACTFAKKDGTITTRLVEDWNKRNTPKGTGRPTKPGQVLFTDLDKEQAGAFSTISTYRNQILNLV